MTSHFTKLLVAAAIAACLGGGALAQTYPERPVTMIVAQSAGGGTDVFARILGRFIEKHLNNATLTVINRPGASGEIGFAELARSEPDGYTIGMLNVPNIVTQMVTKEQPQFTPDDFTYLAKVYSGQTSLVVSNDSPFKTVQDLVDHAKQNPGKIRIGIGGLGADDHLMAVQFMKLAGVEFTVVPMGGGGEARNAVMGGHVDVGSMGLVDGYRFKESLRVLGVMWPDRVPLAPEVPTFKEQGYDLSGGATRLMAAPKGIPEEARAALAKAIEEACKDPEMLAEAEKISSFVDYAGPEGAEAFIREQVRVLGDLWKSDPW